MYIPEQTILAAGPVIIEDGKVLLNREIKRDGKESPFFMFPGGTVEDFSQPLEACAKREVKEELGIDIDILGSLPTLMLERPDGKGYAILVHYLAKRIGEIVPGKETVEWGWYPLNNLPENCAPNVYTICKELH